MLSPMNANVDRQLRARTALLLIAVQLFAAIAMAFSSATAVEYYARSHAFCAAGSGCGAVRASHLGQTLGDALPAIGVSGFLLLLILVSSSAQRPRLLGLSLAVTGGLAGATLLALQAFVVGAWCALCVGADVGAVLAAACALPLLRNRALGLVLAPTARARAFSHGLVVLALFAPPTWALTRPTHVPAYVNALSVAGKINVVEFSDFECPFCRGLHPVLDAVLAPYGERIHFVRKSYPLPGHRHARDADRAYLCAGAQGKAEAMADWLFETDDLSAKSCARHAASLGLEMSRFEACVSDPATERTIKSEMAAIRHDGFHGLPTVWIGSSTIEGFDKRKGSAPYVSALARAEAHDPMQHALLPWALLALATCAVLLPALRRS
jgi:predicted DsbA family dithiol-disulfide isomerase/uncharacterized membrane protein